MNITSGSIANKFTELKVIDLRASERDESSSLFVINLSNPSGNIHFDIETKGGNRNLVYVPAAPVAFDLSMQAVKRDILESPTFRKYLNLGFLRIVDTRQAETFMSVAKNQNEFAKAMRFNMEQSVPQIQQSDERVVDSINDELTPLVINLANEDQMSEQEALELLDQNEHVLTIIDMQYLVDNALHAGVKTWAASRLTK